MLNKMKEFIFIILLVFFVAGNASGKSRENSDLKEEVRTLLRENPEIILDILRENDVVLFDMMGRAAAKKQKLAEHQRIQAEMRNPFKPEIIRSRPVRGNPNAPITIVAYDDFQCPYCAMAAETLDQVLKKYKGKVRLILKHNPLNFHKQAFPAALYFEAIAKQDNQKAWEFHDLAFSQQASLKDGEMALKKIATSLDLDTKRLESDVKDPAIKSIVERDIIEARKFGFRGTPTFLINGVSLRGAASEESFSEIIRFFLKS